VDAAGDAGAVSLVAYTAGGSPQIAYQYSHTSNDGLGGKTSLKYAARSQSAWATAIVDSSAGGPAALLANPISGGPEIGYDCLRLAAANGSSWSTQVIVSRNCSDRVSLAYDTTGILWATYSDVKTHKLVVGRRIGSGWTFETLSLLASYKSLAIMPDGLPAIAFENRAGALVYVKRQSTGAWVATTVEQTANSGYSFISFPTLLVDTDGTPTVAYWGGAVRMARLIGGLWTTETARARVVGESLGALSFAFAAGEPVLVFAAGHLAPNGTISSTAVTAMRKSLTTGTWAASSIDVVPTYVTGTSVAYDPVHGVVGVTYGPRDVADLRFAEGPPAVIGQ